MHQSQYPLSPLVSLPTMYDLPSEDLDEPGLPDEFHDYQPKLLRETCHPKTYPPEEVAGRRESVCDDRTVAGNRE